MKHHMNNIPIWLISSYEEGWNQIGLKPSKKYDVFNGDLRCSFRRYETFSGSKSIENVQDTKKA